jgi:beta-lactamase regulating signal transducer with metallopeptidase domain
MTSELLATLANLGAGAALSSAALPLLARMTAPRFVHDPASSHRAQLWALSLASALMTVPWLRGLVPHGGPGAAASVHPQVAPMSGPTLDASALGFYLLCAVGAVWSIGAAVAAGLACISLVQLSLLIRRARPGPSVIEETVAKCAMRSARRIRRALVSDEASIPFAAIPWAPVLVLPARFPETFDGHALELAVEHEATHIDRGDLWTSALVRALCVLFPFNPLAARMARDIAFAREAAVDARVSARDPHRYATLLLDVAASARFDQLPRPVSMDDTALRRRIEMLTDESTRRPRSVAPVTTAALVLAAAALAAPPVLALPAAPPRAIAGFPSEADRPFQMQTPESSYAACEQKSPGDPCAIPDFGPGTIGTCTVNPANGRVFCAPPPPPEAREDRRFQ